MIIQIDEGVSVEIASAGPIGIPDGHVTLASKDAAERTEVQLPFVLIGEHDAVANVSAERIRDAMDTSMAEAGWGHTPKGVVVREF